MDVNRFTESMSELDDRFYTEAIHYRKPRLIWLRRCAAAAACLALVAACAFAAHTFMADPSPIIEQIAPASDAPDGMRRMLNCGGLRYVFLEDGATYDLSPDLLGDALGTLEYDIESDPQANAGKDLSTTFALGGTVYEIKGYDPAFRIAVELDGSFYLCQSVGYTDGRVLDLAEQFAAADLIRRAEGMLICDHTGSQVLGEVDAEQTAALLEELTSAVPAQLTDEQYQQIGRAQSQGGSYRLLIELDDGTRYPMYVIPSLSIAMVGDGRYTMPQELAGRFSDLTAQLPAQQPMPAQ